LLSYLPLYTVQALGFDAIGAGFLVACSQAGGAVSRLALGVASDRWLAERRSVWLALTGCVGAATFAGYAFWPVSAPLGAGALAFATGVGAYGWVGVFFVISAELGGVRRAGLLSGAAFASIVWPDRRSIASGARRDTGAQVPPRTSSRAGASRALRLRRPGGRPQ